jgi:hypothetical protein
MDLSITVSGSAGPTLQRVTEGITHRRPLNARLGKRGEIELREHFRERNAEPNKQGFPSADFWNRIRKATALSAVDESGATVSISDPAIAQKIYGGTITPKEGKYLTIPAIAAAYGKSPRSINNLEPFVRWINGAPRAFALGIPATTGISSGKKGESESQGTVFYWLVLSVTQKRDPRALPERSTFFAALIEEAGFHVDELRRG